MSVFNYKTEPSTYFDISVERPRRGKPKPISISPPQELRPILPGPSHNQKKSKPTLISVTDYLSRLIDDPQVLTTQQERFMYDIASSFTNTLRNKNYRISDKEITLINSDREVESGTSDSDINESEAYPRFEINCADEKDEHSTLVSSSDNDDEFNHETIPLISSDYGYDHLRSGSCTPDHSNTPVDQSLVTTNRLNSLDQAAKLEIDFPMSNQYWATFESGTGQNDQDNDHDDTTSTQTFENTTQTEFISGNATTQTEFSSWNASTQTEFPCSNASTQAEFSFSDASNQANDSLESEKSTKSFSVQANSNNINSQIEVSTMTAQVDNSNSNYNDETLNEICKNFSSMDASPGKDPITSVITLANRKSLLELKNESDTNLNENIYNSIEPVSPKLETKTKMSIENKNAFQVHPWQSRTCKPSTPFTTNADLNLSSNGKAKTVNPTLNSTKPDKNLEEKTSSGIQSSFDWVKRASENLLGRKSIVSEEKLENTQPYQHPNAVGKINGIKVDKTIDAFKSYRSAPDSASSKTDSSNGENGFDDNFIQSKYSQAIGGLTISKNPLKEPKLNLDGSICQESLTEIHDFLTDIKRDRMANAECQALELEDDTIDLSTSIYSLEVPNSSTFDHSLCTLDLNSLEEPTANDNEYSLSKLSAEELKQMESKTNQLNKKKFEQVNREYRTNQTIVASIKLQLESLKNVKRTSQIETVLKELEFELTYQKDLENKLELELQKISSRRSDIYPAFTMPERYGRKGTYDYRRIEGIPMFSPADKHTRLSHTWEMIKINALAPENDWSKECMKSILHNRLKGEAIDYYMEYKDYPLEDLIVILGKRFEQHKKKSDFEDDFEKFARSPKESLLTCITRLEYIIRRMLCDNTPSEKLVMEKQFLRVKLKKLVPKQVWQSIISLENTRLELGESFDLVHEIQVAEKAYLESHGTSDLDLITSLQAMHTGGTKKNPSQRANSPNPLHTKRMADGTAHIGRGAGGGISKNFRSRSRNRSTPYVSPSNSRPNSRSPSGERTQNEKPEQMNMDFQNQTSKNDPKENNQGTQFEGVNHSTPNFHRSGTDFNRSGSGYNTRYQRANRGKRFFANRGQYGRGGHFSQREQSPDYHFQPQSQYSYQPQHFQQSSDPQPRQENQYWRSREYRQNQPRFFNQGFRGRNRNYGNSMQTFKQEFEIPQRFSQTIQFDNICQLASCRKSNGFVHTKSDCPLNRSHFR